MEFTFDKHLVEKYIVTAIFTTFLAIGFTYFLPILPIIAVVQLILLYFAFGSVMQVIDIFNKIIVVDRDGVHIFRNARRESHIPWDIVDDFSASGSHFAMRVGGKFYKISKELLNYPEFQKLMIDQLTMPLHRRGSNLPILGAPEAFREKIEAEEKAHSEESRKKFSEKVVNEDGEEVVVQEGLPENADTDAVEGEGPDENQNDAASEGDADDEDDEDFF